MSSLSVSCIFTFFFKHLFIYLFIYLFIHSFIYGWLHWVFVAMCGLLIAVASLVAEHGLQVPGFSSCGMQAQ